MLICPHCQGRVAESPELAGQLLACPHCLQHFVQPGGEPLPPAPLKPLVAGMGSTGVRIHGRRSAPKPNINPVAAGMLSLLFPGLGQFAQGRSVEGTLFFVAALVVMACGCLFPPAFFIGLILLGWSIIDAANYSR